MTHDGSVLVVDEEAPEAIAERLADRGLDVEVSRDLATALERHLSECCCVVCGELPGHTPAELVTRLDSGSRTVLFVYSEDEAATSALDAGAAATIPRGDPVGDWGGHLAATVDSMRRRDTAAGDNAPFLSSALDELLDIFFIVSVDGRFLRWNEVFSEVTGYSDAEIAEMQPTAFFEGEDVQRIENAIGRVVVTGRATEKADIVTKDGRAIPHEFTGALVDAGGTRAIVGTARDIRERQRRERELEHQARRLEAVNHTNAVIRDVVAALLAAETREEIAQAVCTKLADAEAYRFAWLGSFDDTGQVEPEAWAGEGEAYLEDRPRPPEADEESVTAATAVRERRVVFAEDVAEDPAAGTWREAALEHGHRAAAAIPVLYGDATYGCLCLYADRANAFDELEREVLAELGEIIGHAVQAAEARRALTADTLTELQLQLVDDESFLVQAAEYTDAELDLVGSVTRADGALVQLFTVSGVEPAVVGQFADAAPMAAEVVTERAEESVVKVTLEDYSVSHALAEVGGTVRSITVADGDVRIRADVPREADTQAVLDQVRTVADVRLLSQREVERPDRTDVDFRADVERHLTDRQVEVLETAFRAGFFDWPRERTGEDVADLLDVAPPTFHQHLRVGERKLLEVLFDQGPPGATATGASSGVGATDLDLSDALDLEDT
ncbi:bacterio-opsin activator domain-containing protein [Halobacteriales archaeon Cl-PHB]